MQLSRDAGALPMPPMIIGCHFRRRHCRRCHFIGGTPADIAAMPFILPPFEFILLRALRFSRRWLPPQAV